ncbi:glycosyltransferase family 4 protein [candidate division KSB1 bacterium]|nr:glycosyltransferase family 4 protein [candidate division KSB1 bacterium]
MRLLFLADSTRVHTHHWYRYFYEKGYEVELISPFPLPDLDIPVHLLKNCQTATGTLRNHWYLHQSAEVRRIIRQVKPDILHALYTTNFGFIGARSAFHPLVISAFGTDVLPTPRKTLFHKIITKYALKTADLIVSVAPYLTPKITRMKINPGRVLNFQYYLDWSQFYPTNHKSLVKPARYTVLSTGNWDGTTNLEAIVTAIPEVLKQHPNVWFIFLGNEPTNTRLNTLARKLQVSDHVALPGLQAHLNMPQYYRLADIYISNSLTNGIPQALFEAMACGAFPIISEPTADPAWIEDGVNGFCVQPDAPTLIAQKIIAAIDSPALRQEAMQKNIEKIKKLTSFEKNLERLEYYYFCLVHKSKFPVNNL